MSISNSVLLRIMVGAVPFSLLGVGLALAPLHWPRYLVIPIIMGSAVALFVITPTSERRWVFSGALAFAGIVGFMLVLGDILRPLLNEGPRRFSWVRLAIASAAYAVLFGVSFFSQSLRRRWAS